VVAAVVAGRLHAVTCRLRVDEIAALRLSDGRVTLEPVHAETVALFQARALTLHQ